MGSLKTLITRAYQILRGSKNGPPSPSPQYDPLLSPEIKSIADTMHTLTAEGVNLHRNYSLAQRNNKDIAFIEILQNSLMTLVIIVIPPGKHLPIHDHPGMLGILKVLHGKVKISTYTKLGDSDLGSGRHTAIRTQDTIMSKHSYPQVLTPDVNNVHGIEYLGGEGDKDYAAFIDILAPPYDDNIGCNYYKCEVEESSGKTSPGETIKKKVGDADDVVTLVEIPCPDDYHSITLPFIP